MNADYQSGRADGLREAVVIVRRLEEAVVARLVRPSGRRTTEARKVRSAAFRVVATRLSTALRKVEKRRAPTEAEITSKIEELGL